MEKIHFLYEIRNKKVKKSYIGVRSSNFIDIGIKYFSSSTDKEFMEEQKLYPYRFDYIVLLLCETKEEALYYEVYLHNYFNVSNNDNFYNKSNQTSKGFDTTGIPFKEEAKVKIKNTLSTKIHKERMSKRNKKRYEDEKELEKLSIAQKNNWKNENYREKMIKKVSNNFKSKKEIKIKKKSKNIIYTFRTFKSCSDFLQINSKSLTVYAKKGFPTKEIKNQHGTNKRLLDFEIVKVKKNEKNNSP